VSQISAATLVVAIKAVNEKATALAKAAENEDDPRLEIIEMQLLDVSKAEIELKRIYEDIQRASDNLPLYEVLIR
jgi:hypothetical protein